MYGDYVLHVRMRNGTSMSLHCADEAKLTEQANRFAMRDDMFALRIEIKGRCEFEGSPQNWQSLLSKRLMAGPPHA